MAYTVDNKYSDGYCYEHGSGKLHVMPRGLRNNNPLNIRHSKDKWQGMKEKQTDKQFVQFKSLAWGFRAGFKTIRTYMTKHGCRNITQIITRWAPPSENNTQAYIQKVSQMAMIHPLDLLDYGEESQMIAIVRAMTYVENGVIIAGDSIREGYALAQP